METKEAHWNKKVAKNRGLEWRKSLLQGRLDVNMHPSVVRLKRIKLNLTQIDMATEVGISYTTYGAVESGRRPVQKLCAEKIAKVLKLSFDKSFEPSKIGKNRFQARREK